MPAKYIFRDTDETGFAEYDISGEEYVALLETCFKYSFSVSFRIYDDAVSKPADLEKYRLPVTDEIMTAYDHFYKELTPKAKEEIHHYQLALNVRKYVKDVTDSI